MTRYINEIEVVFRANAQPEIALGMKNYMKNKFSFLGLQKPLRAELQKPFLQKEKLPEMTILPEIILHFWNLPEREFQYFALDLLEKYIPQSPLEFIELYETLLITKSWWDTVDIIAAKFVGNIFLRDVLIRREYLRKWLLSKNMWLKRTCLLYQLKYKEKTNTRTLDMIINKVIPSHEFFINKAIGWILREYSKTDAKWVIEYVNKTPLEELSKREALKWLRNNGKCNG